MGDRNEGGRQHFIKFKKMTRYDVNFKYFIQLFQSCLIGNGSEFLDMKIKYRLYQNSLIMIF